MDRKNAGQQFEEALNALSLKGAHYRFVMAREDTNNIPIQLADQETEEWEKVYVWGDSEQSLAVFELRPDKIYNVQIVGLSEHNRNKNEMVPVRWSWKLGTKAGMIGWINRAWIEQVAQAKTPEQEAPVAADAAPASAPGKKKSANKSSAKKSTKKTTSEPAE
jgi:hypothetical protein